jgi:Flp pilus assembly protein TadG
MTPMHGTGPTGLIRTLRRFLRQRRGVSAVEFAILLPVMLTVYLGGTELTQGITIKRKTTIATRTIGDLVAQDTSITDAEMTAIFDATASILAPYPTGSLTMIVSSVKIDNAGTATIGWSSGYNGATPYTVNSPVTLPPGLSDRHNTTLIWAQAEYTYLPTIGYVISGQMKLTDKVYLRPRLVNCVSRNSGNVTIGC